MTAGLSALRAARAAVYRQHALDLVAAAEARTSGDPVLAVQYQAVAEDLTAYAEELHPVADPDVPDGPAYLRSPASGGLYRGMVDDLARAESIRTTFDRRPALRRAYPAVRADLAAYAGSFRRPRKPRVGGR